MSTTTPNFNFPIPQSTDLVKDGATAIASLGTAIDTDFVDLKGGTTGQVLSKASNANMDFTWVTSDDANAIQNAIVDAKGDLIAASAADTPARLAVGANDTILMADSTTATGLKWAGTYTAYTPTITATSGTFTTVTPVGVRYLQIGKMVHIIGRINIVNKGTASGAMVVTLPFTSVSTTDQVGFAEEIGAVGFGCFGLVPANNAAMAIRQLNYGSPIGDGNGISFSLTYEVA